MTEIGPRGPAADGTATRLVERPLVVEELCVLDIEPAARRERLARAAVAGRQNAVEHVDAARDCFDEIFWRADAHQVPRRISRHSWRHVFDYFKHHCLLFPHPQPADRVAVEADVDGLFETDPPQI